MLLRLRGRGACQLAHQLACQRLSRERSGQREGASHHGHIREFQHGITGAMMALHRVPMMAGALYCAADLQVNSSIGA